MLTAKKKDLSTLYCFSPAVMLATFSIEWALALYVLLRYGRYRIAQIATALLFFLGLFQFAEYHICGGNSNNLWTTIGLGAITLLPPLGLHLIAATTNRLRIAWTGYAIALFFLLAFLILPGAVNGSVCTGNYIILNIAGQLSFAYGFYYFGFLFLGIWEAYQELKTATQKMIRQRLSWMMIGYASFMLPMAIAYIFLPATRAAVPSVMCGFAVILAIILAWKIAPTAATTSQK